MTHSHWKLRIITSWLLFIAFFIWVEWYLMFVRRGDETRMFANPAVWLGGGNLVVVLLIAALRWDLPRPGFRHVIPEAVIMLTSVAALIYLRLPIAVWIAITWPIAIAAVIRQDMRLLCEKPGET